MSIQETIAGLCAINAVDLELVKLHREDGRFQEAADAQDARLQSARDGVALLEAEIEARNAKCVEMDEVLAKEEAESAALEAQLVEEIDSQERYQKIAREQDIIRKRIEVRTGEKAKLAEDLKRAEVRLADAQESLKALAREVSGKKGANTREKGRHEEALAALNVRRSELAGALDPKLLARYDKAARKCGNGLAVVRMKGSTPVCSGCNMSVLFRTYSKLLSGVIDECGLCHRLIYAEKFAPEGVASVPATPPKVLRKAGEGEEGEGGEG